MARRDSSKRSGAPVQQKRVRAEGMDETGELFPHEERTNNRRQLPEVPEHDLPAPPATHGASVPKQWVKFLVGLLLLPPALILTESFFQAFTSSIHNGLLANQSFGCFAAGILLFIILFVVVPRKVLMLPYVFGHEVTHALWVKLFGGKVANQFHVSLEGGHVMTDRVNTWIVLSPYFFPIYSVLSVTLYGALSLSAYLIDLLHQGSDLATGVASLRWVLFLLLGLTLAFHLVFTFLLITKGQPDLHYGGTFFSLMVIYLINLLIITGLLLVTGKSTLWYDFGESLLRNAEGFVELCGRIAAWIYVWIQEFRAGLGK